MKSLVVATSVLLIGCAQNHSQPPATDSWSVRLAAIEQGIKLRRQDPLAAAEFLRDAGPGPDLEATRLDVWLKCLQDGDAAASGWVDFLAQAPPVDEADQARLALARVLAQKGELPVAATVLDEVSVGRRSEADVVRLLWPKDSPERAGAAIDLARRAPVLLRAEDPDLDDWAREQLEQESLLERAVAWRESGSPKRAAAELRRLRVGGLLEAERRRELARAELDLGSTSRALSVLPSLARSSTEEALLHAEAWRSRGWARFPSSSAKRAFDECLKAARVARSSGGENRIRALELELECATETGRLDLGIEAWRILAREHWEGELRSWLGRRLGVALVLDGGRREEVDLLARSLPGESRCLEFWNADYQTAAGRQVLKRIADAPSSDLYALWSRSDLGLAPTELPVRSSVSAPAGKPPPAVRFLIDLGEEGLASVEWRRLRWGRTVGPGEGLAAAAFEARRGRGDLGIRWLRQAYPDLGTVAMAATAEEATRAYLPLKWAPAVRAAATEAGIEPWLLAGLARQESIFNAEARSPAGAIGLVQLMRPTARGHAVALGLGRSPDLRDPVVNLRLGARELAGLLARFQAVEPALAAYNAGETRVRGWWRIWRDPRVFTEKVPISETYSYIRRVRFLADAYRTMWVEEWGGRKSEQAEEMVSVGPD